MHKQLLHISAFILLAILAFFSCQTSDFDVISFSDISVETTEVSITETSATVSGSIMVIQLEKEGVSMNRGIVWSNTNSQPDITSDNFESNTVDIADEVFTVEIKPLETGVNYHARAFAEIADSVIYGETLSFSVNWIRPGAQANSPTARENATVINLGSEVLISFGNNAEELFRNSWKYIAGTWSQTSAAFNGTERTGAVGFSINGTSYIGLGVGENGDLLSDFWTYDASSGWAFHPSTFPAEAEGAVAFSIGEKGYAGMGKSFSNFYNQLHELEAGGTWQPVNYQGAQAPVGRSDAVVFVNGDKAYIGLGRSEAGLLDDFFVFNTSDNTWTELPPFPGGGRSGAIAFFLNGKGYVGMGTTGNGLKNDIWEFDPSKSEPWELVAQFPSNPKANMSVFTIDDKKAMIGLGKRGNTYFNDWWEFTPSSN